MSNYTKSTNFAAKDSLPSGNANKVVKGTEINTEFDNIATAIATKADLNSPTLVTPNLGTPSAAVLTNATGLPLTTGVTGTLPVANGGTGATTFSAGALLKGAGTSAITTATAGTDYAPATSGTSILKGNGSGGFSSVVSGTDIKTINSTSLLGSGDIAITSTPGGSNTQVQYNNAGAFGGSANFVFDGTNVGIGVTPNAWGSFAKALQIGSRTAVYQDTNDAVFSNNSYGATGGNIYIATAAATQYYQSAGTHVWRSAPSGTAGTTITFTQVLAVEKDKSLALQGATSQSGTGITFPATQSASSDANTLDDYEEGTWTPSLGGTATYSEQTGTYTKIGRQVTVKCRLAVTSIGTGSTRTISGLPFTPGENASSTAPYFDTVSTNIVYLTFLTNSTTLDAYSATAATGTLTGAANPIFKNGTTVEFYCTYFV